VAIHQLADMTWEEVRDLDRARTVAILPVGAIEAHGPHLPLGTDVVIAQAMARAGALELNARGLEALILPAFPYTAAGFASGFAGTISVLGVTVTALLLDLTRELTRQGFRALAVANAHLDPANLDSIASATLSARAGGMIPLICPDITKKPWATRLTEEFRSGACHAGRYESSIVLAERSDLVREEERKKLPPNPASIGKAIRSGATSFEEANGRRAYFGWPADATSEEGRESVEALGAILADAVSEALAPTRGA
jgi:creatinine amidohydrolase